MRGKISPTFHVKNGVKNGKFHANFTLLGRSAEINYSVRYVINFEHYSSNNTRIQHALKLHNSLTRAL